jgi:hypothetical protein
MARKFSDGHTNDPEKEFYEDRNAKPTACRTYHIVYKPHPTEKDTIWCAQGCSEKVLLLKEKIDGRDWVYVE